MPGPIMPPIVEDSASVMMRRMPSATTIFRVAVSMYYSLRDRRLHTVDRIQ
jgi:hypothetical protein